MSLFYSNNVDKYERIMRHLLRQIWFQKINNKFSWITKCFSRTHAPKLCWDLLNLSIIFETYTAMLGSTFDKNGYYNEKWIGWLIRTQV